VPSPRSASCCGRRNGSRADEVLSRHRRLPERQPPDRQRESGGEADPGKVTAATGLPRALLDSAPKQGEAVAVRLGGLPVSALQGPRDAAVCFRKSLLGVCRDREEPSRQGVSPVETDDSLLHAHRIVLHQERLDHGSFHAPERPQVPQRLAVRIGRRHHVPSGRRGGPTRAVTWAWGTVRSAFATATSARAASTSARRIATSSLRAAASWRAGSRSRGPRAGFAVMARTAMAGSKGTRTRFQTKSTWRDAGPQGRGWRRCRSGRADGEGPDPNRLRRPVRDDPSGYEAALQSRGCRPRGAFGLDCGRR